VCVCVCVCVCDLIIFSEVNVGLQLKELEEAEAEAEKQVSEAREAEVKMEKERDEMLAWRAKAQRYLENFQASCKRRGVSEDIEHDQLKMDHPDLWREKNQLSGIQMRADKEKAQYDDSMANLNQERAEVRYFRDASFLSPPFQFFHFPPSSFIRIRSKTSCFVALLVLFPLIDSFLVE
jgi:hypothetical protein